MSKTIKVYKNFLTEDFEKQNKLKLGYYDIDIEDPNQTKFYHTVYKGLKQTLRSADTAISDDGKQIYSVTWKQDGDNLEIKLEEIRKK